MEMCFVLMPFSSEFKNQWELGFIPAIESLKLQPYRGDDKSLGTNMIMRDVTQCIHNARIVIADLTGRNPNVMYELGLAHAAKKKAVIMLAQKDEDVPFDLRHIRYLRYDKGDLKTLQDDLKTRIGNTLNQATAEQVDFFPELRLMKDTDYDELIYLRQKARALEIEVDPSTADIFFNDKLLPLNTRMIRVNPDAQRNTLSAADIEHFDYHRDITREVLETGKVVIALDLRDKGLPELERRVPRWLRYRRRDPNNPVLMRAICQYLELTGEIEDADVEAKELLEVCPDWWLSSYQAARICVSKGQDEEAIRLFSRAVALRGDKAVGYLALACMYSRTHQYAECINQLSTLQSRDDLVQSYGGLKTWTILQDEDFNNIKNDPEYGQAFVKIVKDIESKSA